MKHCKLIVLCISSIAIVICAVMIIRINVLYPNAEVISYTKDNPVDINGLEVKPIDYSVYTLDEFSEISSEYDRYLKRENKDKKRVVVFTLSVRNTTDDIISYSPSFVMVIEELCASNGAFPIINNDNPSQQSINVLPGEERQLVLKSMLSTSMLKYENFDKIESSTMTLVYSFYPLEESLYLIRGEFMGNRTWKKLCFALIYLIPVIIFISTLSKMYKVFWNVNACMSDYYLAVFDWKTISFMGLFEMIYVSFVSIVIIKRNMTSNRIVLYQLMGKMWRDCIKRGILITLLIPVVNCLIIMLTGLREGAVFGCNWNITGSLAKTWIPYHELAYENTFAVIVLMLLLDILRLQIVYVLLCLLYWITRSAVWSFIIIYFNVLFLSIGKTGLFDRFVMYQTDMYIYGISVFNNIVLPVIIWAVCVAVSYLTFRFYRKDMLKN